MELWRLKSCIIGGVEAERFCNISFSLGRVGVRVRIRVRDKGTVSVRIKVNFRVRIKVSVGVQTRVKAMEVGGLGGGKGIDEAKGLC